MCPKVGVDAEPVYFFSSRRAVYLPENLLVFGFPVSLYGICLVIAALFGILITILEAKKRNHNAEEYLTVLCLVFLFGGIGARAGYVLFHWDFFERNVFWTLDFRTGGLSFYGALFGAWLSVREYCKRTKTEFSTVTDALCTAASISAVFVWIGCILQKEPFGKYYSGVFSIGVHTDLLYLHLWELPGKGLAENTVARDGYSVTFLHPVAIYGLLSAILIAVFIRIARHFCKTDGTLFLLYLFLSAAQNLILALFTLGSCSFFGIRLPMTEIVSVVLLASILAQLFLKKQKKT